MKWEFGVVMFVSKIKIRKKGIFIQEKNDGNCQYSRE